MILSHKSYEFMQKPIINLLNLEKNDKKKVFKSIIKPNLDIFIIKTEKIAQKNIKPEEIEKFKQSYETKAEVPSTILHDITIKNSNVTPYPLKATIKLFEDLMDKKFMLDCKELKEFKKPRDLSDFLIDYMNRSFGIQSVAQKTLNRLLLTLESSKDNPYLILFCRLLKILYPRPIPLNLLTYLCRIRVDFNALIEKFQAKSLQQKQNSEKLDSFQKELGGNALLLDVFELIQKKFKSKKIQKHIFQQLCPNGLEIHKYLIYYSCYRISKSGQIFNINIKEQTRSKIFDEFFSFIDFKMTEEQVNDASNYFYKEEIKKLANAISIKTYNENVLNRRYSISKCQFLNILIQVYDDIKPR